MKLFLSAFVAAGIATAVSAGNSDRYNDLRFDSAIGHVTQSADASRLQDGLQPVALSSRNESSERTPYPYISPYGVGPSNDSR